MQNHISMSDVADRIHKDDELKWDAVVKPDQFHFEQGRLALPATVSGQALQPNSWATGQLCKMLGMPAEYFRKCPPHLQDDQFNHWAEKRWRDDESSKEQRPLMLRAKGDELRAVLSSRYAKIDNGHLWACLEQLQDMGLQVEGVTITDISFHLRLVTTERHQLVKVGDEALAGIHIANSEVGFRSITVDALVHRLVCSNGLVRLIKGKSFIDRRHVGVGVAAVREALPGAIRQALGEARQAVTLFALTASTHIDRPESWIPATINRWQLGEDVLKSVLQLMMTERTEQQDTLWSFINAVTAVAQDKDPDERYRMEVLAGRLLAEPNSVMALPVAGAA